jgi:hypothetical protein
MCSKVTLGFNDCALNKFTSIRKVAKIYTPIRST